MLQIIAAVVTLAIMAGTLVFVLRGGVEGMMQRRLAREWRITERWITECAVNGERIGPLCMVGEVNGLGKRRIRIAERPPERYGSLALIEAYIDAVKWANEPEASCD